MLRTSNRYVFHKHAKLLRQCAIFWPRNRHSRERMTAPVDAKNRSLNFVDLNVKFAT